MATRNYDPGLVKAYALQRALEKSKTPLADAFLARMEAEGQFGPTPDRYPESRPDTNPFVDFYKGAKYGLTQTAPSLLGQTIAKLAFPEGYIAPKVPELGIAGNVGSVLTMFAGDPTTYALGGGLKLLTPAIKWGQAAKATKAGKVIGKAVGKIPGVSPFAKGVVKATKVGEKGISTILAKKIAGKLGTGAVGKAVGGGVSAATVLGGLGGIKAPALTFLAEPGQITEPGPYAPGMAPVVPAPGPTLGDYALNTLKDAAHGAAMGAFLGPARAIPSRLGQFVAGGTGLSLVGSLGRHDPETGEWTPSFIPNREEIIFAISLELGLRGQAAIGRGLGFLAKSPITVAEWKGIYRRIRPKSDNQLAAEFNRGLQSVEGGAPIIFGVFPNGMGKWEVAENIPAGKIKPVPGFTERKAAEPGSLKTEIEFSERLPETVVSVMDRFRNPVPGESKTNVDGLGKWVEPGKVLVLNDWMSRLDVVAAAERGFQIEARQNYRTTLLIQDEPGVRVYDNVYGAVNAAEAINHKLFNRPPPAAKLTPAPTPKVDPFVPKADQGVSPGARKKAVKNLKTRINHAVTGLLKAYGVKPVNAADRKARVTKLMLEIETSPERFKGNDVLLKYAGRVKELREDLGAEIFDRPPYQRGGRSQEPAPEPIQRTQGPALAQLTAEARAVVPKPETKAAPKKKTTPKDKPPEPDDTIPIDEALLAHTEAVRATTDPATAQHHGAAVQALLGLQGGGASRVLRAVLPGPGGGSEALIERARAEAPALTKKEERKKIPRGDFFAGPRVAGALVRSRARANRDPAKQVAVTDVISLHEGMNQSPAVKQMLEQLRAVKSDTITRGEVQGMFEKAQAAPAARPEPPKKQTKAQTESEKEVHAIEVEESPGKFSASEIRRAHEYRASQAEPPEPPQKRRRRAKLADPLTSEMDPGILRIGDELRIAGEVYRVKDVDKATGRVHLETAEGREMSVSNAHWKAGDTVDIQGRRMEIVDGRAGVFTVTPDGNSFFKVQIQTAGKPLLIDRGSYTPREAPRILREYTDDMVLQALRERGLSLRGDIDRDLRPRLARALEQEPSTGIGIKSPGFKDIFKTPEKSALRVMDELRDQVLGAAVGIGKGAVGLVGKTRPGKFLGEKSKDRILSHAGYEPMTAGEKKEAVLAKIAAQAKRAKRGKEHTKRKLAEEIGELELMNMEITDLMNDYNLTVGQGRELVHYRMDQAVRGNIPMEELPPSIRQFAQRFRLMLDETTTKYIEELRRDPEYLEAVEKSKLTGDTRLVRTMEAELGRYMHEAILPTPIEQAKQSWRGRAKQGKLIEDITKFKKDRWTVYAGKWRAKFSSEGKARTFYEDAVLGGKLKKWAEREGLTEGERLKAVAEGTTKIEPPYTESERILMGFDRDIRTTLARSLTKAAHNIGLLRLGRKLANPEHGYAFEPPAHFDKAQTAQWAKQNKLVLFESSPRKYGALAGKYVPKAVASQLREMTLVHERMGTLWQDYLNIWKASKVVWNPGTHIRNLTGNILFSHLADNWILNPTNLKYYIRALGDLHTKGSFTRRLTKAGVMQGFHGTEIREAMGKLREDAGRLNSVVRALQKFYIDSPVGRKLGRIYNLEDMIFKVATLMKYEAEGYRGRVMKGKAAMRLVDRKYPNYAKTAPWAKRLSRNVIGDPFIAFSYHAGMILGRAAVEQPIKLLAYATFPQWFSLFSKVMLDPSDEEWDMIMANKGWGEIVKPWRDHRGRITTWNLTYSFPFLPEFIGMFGRLMDDKPAGIDLPLIGGQPPVAVLGQLQQGRTWTGAPAARRTDTPLVKAGKLIRGAWEGALPLPSLVIYGTGFPGTKTGRITAAMRKETDETVWEALGQVFIGVNWRGPHISHRKMVQSLQEMALENPQVSRFLESYIVRGFPQIPYKLLKNNIAAMERLQNIVEVYNEVYISVGGKLFKAPPPITDANVLGGIRTVANSYVKYASRLTELANKRVSAEYGHGPELLPGEKGELERMEGIYSRVAGFVEAVEAAENIDEKKTAFLGLRKLIRSIEVGRVETMLRSPSFLGVPGAANPFPDEPVEQRGPGIPVSPAAGG